MKETAMFLLLIRSVPKSRPCTISAAKRGRRSRLCASIGGRDKWGHSRLTMLGGLGQANLGESRRATVIRVMLECVSHHGKTLRSCPSKRMFPILS